MARFTFTLFALLFTLLCFFQAEAAPLGSRQVGNLQCNVARLRVVAGLKQSAKAVAAVDTAGDATAATAVQDAQAGVTQAQDGVKVIGQALISGAAAPAEGRTAVEDGLTAATTAITGLGDATGASAALAALQKTTQAGADVAANCK